MRIITLLGLALLLLVALSLGACNTADPAVDDEDEPLFGYVRALINGEPWESTDHRAQAAIRYDLAVFTMRATRADESIHPWNDNINIHLPMTNRVIFESNMLHIHHQHDSGISTGNIFGSTLIESHSDVILGTYKGIEDDGNLFRVDSYDETTSSIQGVFETTLVVEYRVPADPRADTLRITEGEFRLLFEDHR